jgi:hypothetical protein
MNIADNISAFTNVIGAKNPDIVFGFASIDWNSKEERNNFINELVKLNGNKKIGD